MDREFLVSERYKIIPTNAITVNRRIVVAQLPTQGSGNHLQFCQMEYKIDFCIVVQSIVNDFECLFIDCVFRSFSQKIIVKNKYPETGRQKTDPWE